MLEMFDPEAGDLFRPAFSYFRTDPQIETAAITYYGSDHGPAPERHWFIHTLGGIVQDALDAGLHIEGLQEFAHSIREVDYDIYENRAAQIPLILMLRASKARGARVSEKL